MDNLVSIIIPVYKVEPYIRHALDSVVSQTYRNLQIILVDDGSPDNCGVICDEYASGDSRITVIHKENGGVSSARNTGMDMATGEWIYFMDADDWIEPKTIELALASAKKTGADMVFFGVDHVESGHHYRMKILKNIDETREGYWSDLTDIRTFMTFYGGGIWASIIRLNRIKGKVYFDTGLRAFEDIIFRGECYRFIHSFSYIPDVCYHYRQTPGSATNGHIDPNEYLNCSKIRCEQLKSYAYLFLEKEPLLTFACNEYLNSVSKIAITIIQNDSASFSEKYKYIKDAILSPYYEECYRHYNKAFASKTTRISAMLGRPTVGSVYFAYSIRKLYRPLKN